MWPGRPPDRHRDREGDRRGEGPGRARDRRDPRRRARLRPGSPPRDGTAGGAPARAAAHEEGAGVIGRVAVVGAGVMGSEIAQAAASGGVEVVLLDPTRGARAGARPRRADRRAQGRARADERRRGRGDRPPRHPQRGRRDLGSCDLAIEAVPEVMDVKRRSSGASTRPCRPPRCSRPTPRGCRSPPSAARRPSRPRPGAPLLQPARQRLVEVVRGDTSEGPWRPASLRRPGQGAGAGARVPLPRQPRPLPRPGRATATRPRSAPTGRGHRVVEGPRVGPFALGDLIASTPGPHPPTSSRPTASASTTGAVSRGRRAARQQVGRRVLRRRAPEAAADGPGGGRHATTSAPSTRPGAAARGEAAPGDIDPAMRHGCGWSRGPLAWAQERGLTEAVPGKEVEKT